MHKVDLETKPTAFLLLSNLLPPATRMTMPDKDPATYQAGD